MNTRTRTGFRTIALWMAIVIIPVWVIGALLTTQAYAHTVERVIDGDTLVVRDEQGEQTTVRLLNVNTPEMDSPIPFETCYAQQAKEYLGSVLAPGTKVRLETDEQLAALVAAAVAWREAINEIKRLPHGSLAHYLAQSVAHTALESVSSSVETLHADATREQQTRAEAARREAERLEAERREAERLEAERHAAEQQRQQQAAQQASSPQGSSGQAAQAPAGGGSDGYTGCRAYGGRYAPNAVDAQGRPYTRINCTTKTPI